MAGERYTVRPDRQQNCRQGTMPLGVGVGAGVEEPRLSQEIQLVVRGTRNPNSRGKFTCTTEKKLMLQAGMGQVP